MKKRFIKHKILLGVGAIVLFMSPAFGDAACDAELAALQAEIDTPTAGASAADLEQAQGMTNILSDDCAGGSPLESIQSLADLIRSTLGMGAAP